MSSDTMVTCGIAEDEDGQYLTINDQRGNTRVQYVESGEEASNGFVQALPARAFGGRSDGTIKVVICDTDDKRASTQIYVVPKEDVFSRGDFLASIDSCC